MAKIWKKRIEAGDKLFSNCPRRYQDEVLELLRQDVKDFILNEEQFKELTGKDY